MNTGQGPGARPRFRSLAVALAVVLALWPLCAEAADATAGTLPPGASSRSAAPPRLSPESAASGSRAESIHAWLGAFRIAPPSQDPLDRPGASETGTRAEAQRGYRGRRGRGDRGVAGLVLGAIGGFAAGGAIGAAVGERYCHCEDPGLHGFIIGAPIGAVVGGFIGYALTR